MRLSGCFWFRSRSVFIFVCCAVFPLVSGAETPVKKGLNLLPRVFPAIYFSEYYREWLAGEAAKPYWALSETEHRQFEIYVRDNRPFFSGGDILAFYGHPDSPNMGILGRYDKAELKSMLDALAAEYHAVNGNRIQKAFYLIYGTVQPRGNIGYIDEATLHDYLEFTLENDMLLFIDHQMGRYDPLDSLKELLPYLKYPHVHLALDPEWRTDQPMRLIGSVSGEEINRAQETMSRYIEEHEIPGERMLVIHQFDRRMIKNRELIQTGYKQVRLVHCADGFGSPELKRGAYAYNARADNIPVKGFKLFYDSGIPGAGRDKPLLTPVEVNALVPRPLLVMYQ